MMGNGGLFVNYPINECIEEQKCELNEVLGLKDMNSDFIKKITNDSSFIDFVYAICMKAIKYIRKEENIIKIPNEIESNTDICGSYDKWYEILLKRV